MNKPHGSALGESDHSHLTRWTEEVHDYPELTCCALEHYPKTAGDKNIVPGQMAQSCILLQPVVAETQR